MVLYVTKYDIAPGKEQAYAQWAGEATRRALAIPGMVELRAYRAAAGAQQVVVTYEFVDMPAWAAWECMDDAQKLEAELHTVANNVTHELWGPSPVVPAPVRPGK